MTLFHEKSLAGKLRHIADDLEELTDYPLHFDDVQGAVNPDTLREIADEVENAAA